MLEWHQDKANIIFSKFGKNYSRMDYNETALPTFEPLDKLVNQSFYPSGQMKNWPPSFTKI